jgi:hypothetical protein
MELLTELQKYNKNKYNIITFCEDMINVKNIIDENNIQNIELITCMGNSLTHIKCLDELVNLLQRLETYLKHQLHQLILIDLFL